MLLNVYNRQGIELECNPITSFFQERSSSINHSVRKSICKLFTLLQRRKKSSVFLKYKYIHHNNIRLMIRLIDHVRAENQWEHNAATNQHQVGGDKSKLVVTCSLLFTRWKLTKWRNALKSVTDKGLGGVQLVQ